MSCRQSICRRNVLSTKCRVDEKVSTKCLSTKCCVDEVPCRRKFFDNNLSTNNILTDIIIKYCGNSSIDSYWPMDASLQNEKVSKSMSRKSCERILDNSKATERGDLGSKKLYKVVGVLELLIHYFQTYLNLGEKLTSDI